MFKKTNFLCLVALYVLVSVCFLYKIRKVYFDENKITKHAITVPVFWHFKDSKHVVDDCVLEKLSRRKAAFISNRHLNIRNWSDAEIATLYIPNGFRGWNLGLWCFYLCIATPWIMQKIATDLKRLLFIGSFEWSLGKMQ